MTAYTLPDLPYDYGALEPHYSAQTLELHHDKHHAAYVKGANETFEKLEAGYGYSHWADGSRRFDFIAETNIPEIQPDNNPEYLQIRQRYVPDGRGRAEVGVKGADLGTFTGYETECWDACFQRTFFFSNVGKPQEGELTACAPDLQKDPPR